MAFSTEQGLVDAHAYPQTVRFLKTSIGGNQNNTFVSLWTATGLPAAGAAPFAAGSIGNAVPTSATTGALSVQNAASGVLHLSNFQHGQTVQTNLYMYDRLVHSAGFSGTAITAQSIASPVTVNRPSAATASYEHTEMWVEVYTALGGTGTTATVSYTNSAGTSGRTGNFDIPASAPAGQMIPVRLQAGDIGVQSIQSVTLTASTTVAGNFGINIMRPLVLASIGDFRVAEERPWLQTALARVDNNACLAFIMYVAGTITGELNGALTLVEG